MANQRINAWESEGRGREGNGSYRGSGGDSAILDRVCREDTAELALEQRFGESEGVSCVNILEEEFAGSRKSICKGPEVETQMSLC